MRANADRRANTLLSSPCLGMLVLSCVFWYSSLPYLWFAPSLDLSPLFEEGYPNCVSACVGTRSGGVAHLSHNGISSCYLTRNLVGVGDYASPSAELPVARWVERPDGHYCGLLVQPYIYGDQPRGLRLYLTSRTVGWDCPYLLMIAAWLAAFYVSNRGFRLRLMHLFAATTAIAISAAAIKARSAALITVPLSLASAALLLGFLVSAIAVLVFGKNRWWPIVIKRTEKRRQRKRVNPPAMPR